MHVYALIKNPSTAIALPTGTAHALQLVEHGAITAVTEPELHLADLQQDQAALLHAIVSHDRIIQELFEQTTVLPLRFTNTVTLPELIADLTNHQTRYIQQLDALADKAEYTLKLLPLALNEEPLVLADLKGKDYFLAKKHYLQELHHQQEQQTEELENFLFAIAQQYPIQQSDPTPDKLIMLHVLIEQTSAERFWQSLRQWQTQLQMWNLSFSEPLPPYHFAQI